MKLLKSDNLFFCRSDAQRLAKQKEAKERELEHAAFSADRIEEGGFPMSMVSAVGDQSNYGRRRSFFLGTKIIREIGFLLF